MSTERDQREFERYLEYQRAQRHHRVETLGGSATVLFLSTIDLGLTGAGDPASEAHTSPSHDPEVAPVIEMSELRATRSRRLAGIATEAAELGHARAA